PREGADASRVGVVPHFADDLELALSERSDVWVELVHADDPGSEPLFNIELGQHKIPVQIVRRVETAVEAEKFFRQRSEGERFWDTPNLWWGDVSGQLVRAGDARPVAQPLEVSLHSTPRIVLRLLFSASAELDTAAWGALFVLAFLLFDVYVVAA